ncbi:MAG: hypothetical protein ACJ76Y_26375 [Thermoanaerobaculia bacterium]
MPEVSVEKGSVLWSVNRFRSDALGSLLDDLVVLEDYGLDEELCKKVRRALARITNAATELPDDAWWKRQIWKELQSFETIYEQWNNIDGGEEKREARKDKLRQLRKRRNKIATKIRKNQYIIQNELDLKLVRDGYEALGDLSKALPDLFKNLAAAIGRFAKEAA